MPDASQYTAIVRAQTNLTTTAGTNSNTFRVPSPYAVYFPLYKLVSNPLGWKNPPVPSPTPTSASWVERNYTQGWYSIASSADGTKLAACAASRIWTSTDSGATWIERTSGVRSDILQSIASSADGTKLVACSFRWGYVYTSSNSGISWTRIDNVGSRDWTAVASSADGTKLIACASLSGGVGVIRSINSGVSWTMMTVMTSKLWQCVASSADGVVLLAGIYGEYVWRSTNSGSNWTPTPLPLGAWTSLACSSDGTKLAACGENTNIWTSSDSGATWIERTGSGSRKWYSIASSADGTKLAACVGSGGFVYISTNSGSTWTQQTAPGSKNWRCIASSADGTKLVAGISNGKLWTYA